MFKIDGENVYLCQAIIDPGARLLKGVFLGPKESVRAILSMLAKGDEVAYIDGTRHPIFKRPELLINFRMAQVEGNYYTGYFICPDYMKNVIRTDDELFTVLQRQTDIPLLKEWMSVFKQELFERDYIFPLTDCIGVDEELFGVDNVNDSIIAEIILDNLKQFRAVAKKIKIAA